jgi:sugar phosphate isomerase/epimerase
MKLAFTTLGCPDWDIDTIIHRAREYGYQGVDFRGYRGAMDIPALPEFSTHLNVTAARFRDAGLEVPGFSSSARIFAAPAEALEEIRAYAAICPAFGAQFIRVFGGALGATPRDAAVQQAARTLREAAAIAVDAGATIVLETHDDWIAAQDVAAVLEHADAANAGALWDVHNPYRMRGEAPDDTWRILGRWIKYTHVKDSRRAPESASGYELCLTGAGDIPLAAIVAVLKHGRYSGYLTFEWEKRWHPELPPPEEAFPGYVACMRGLLAAHT